MQKNTKFGVANLEKKVYITNKLIFEVKGDNSDMHSWNCPLFLFE